jgi:hypothetical protein
MLEYVTDAVAWLVVWVALGLYVRPMTERGFRGPRDRA